ncbi:MAG TPA: type II toxin-antitoxin system ParD family antitoxin [Gemmataceae bacterium]|nr:type II toxin-antitoxin system ParD family antitoxin [Gemmataceae bacterium]
MNVTVRPELESFVNELVATGRYLGPDEVIYAALLFLKDQEDLRKIHLEELRKEIAVGLEQANRGEVAPLDMDAILAKSRERLNHLTKDGDAPSPANQPGRG